MTGKRFLSTLALLYSFALPCSGQAPKPALDGLLRESERSPLRGGSDMLGSPGVLDIKIQGAGIALPAGLPDPDKVEEEPVVSAPSIPSPVPEKDEEGQTDKAEAQ